MRAGGFRFFLAIFLFFSLAVSGGADEGNIPPGEIKAWTCLVYMAGDNDLDDWGWFSLDLLAGGLTDDRDINIVVLYDHMDANAELIRVTAAGTETIGDYGEPDMGDPQTLYEFLSMGIRTFPAERYAVVLWDHGGGWKYFAKDEFSHSRMSIDGLTQAMADATGELGRKFDVTIFDACTMAIAEVAHEMRNVTDYLVGSLYTVSSEGFPYDRMIARLAENPQMSNREYAHGIADDYHDFHVDTFRRASLSVIAIDESKMDQVTASVDELSQSLIADMDNLRGHVSSAKSVAEHQVWGGGLMGAYWYIDLVGFADTICKRISDPIICEQAEAVKTAVRAAGYSRQGKTLEKFSEGLGISFPPSLASYSDVNYLHLNYQGIGLDFTADTHWDEMLLSFYTANNAPHTP